MPGWAVVAIASVGVLLLLAGCGVGVYFGWRGYVRRALVRLVGGAEAIEAAGNALIDVVTRLAHADDEVLTEFAQEAESSERRALHEVATRTHMLAGELDVVALPKALVPVAETLADAAMVVYREASRVQDAHTESMALDALSQVDLSLVSAYLKSARDRLNEACADNGLSDMAVYGGGLYL